MFKLFRKLGGKEEPIKEKKDEPNIGDRFGFCYRRLQSPLACIEDVGDERGEILELVQAYHLKKMGELRDLYTVLEYIGDDQYKDLITGEIFTNRTIEPRSVENTVTQSTEKEALTMKKYLLEHPVSISNYNRKLTPAIKTMIMEETIPRTEELTTVLRDVMDDASQKMADFYDELDSKAMDRMYNAAVREDSERTREQERKAAEEKARIERERQRVERERQKRIQEEHEAEVAEAFDQLFSSNSKTR